MSRKVLSEENSFTNANGQNIFTKYWKPIDEKARALIFITHGFGEHCSRYETLGTALAEEGFLAFSHDHIGHGRSEGERVQIQDFSLYVRDVFTHIDQVTAENTGLPIFIFGHSMGGPITILSIFKRPSFFAGAILIAPAIKSDPNKASTLMVFLGRIVACIAPSYQLLPPIDPSLLTRNPVEAEKYANDPLIWHEGMKAKWTVQILAAMEEIQKHVSNITIPYLLLHGDDDRVCLIDGSHFLYDNSASTDKTFKVYKDGRHELLHETKETADQVLQDILDWLKRKLA